MSRTPAQSVTLHVATDHAGLSLKDAVKEWLLSEGFTVVDHGALTLQSEDDFTDYISKVAKAVSRDPYRNKAIVFGGSGQGEAMMANRFKRVRAAVFYGGNEDIVPLSRQHNDANVLSLAARFVDEATAKRVIWTWLHTGPAPEHKYQRRNRELDSLSRFTWL
ncbi:MAG: RpiB/LacA/LacB family sugar-phosphate isomerase [Patescibacteria group bacterium]